jgi:hypothetical protein
LRNKDYRQFAGGLSYPAHHFIPTIDDIGLVPDMRVKLNSGFYDCRCLGYAFADAGMGEQVVRIQLKNHPFLDKINVKRWRLEGRK